MSDRTRPELADSQALMRYDANKKSPLIAYLLWFFLGYLGAHRFYAGKMISGLAMLLLCGLSFLLTFIAIGVLGYLVIGAWWLIDAFLIPGWMSQYNNRLIASINGR